MILGVMNDFIFWVQREVVVEEGDYMFKFNI